MPGPPGRKAQGREPVLEAVFLLEHNFQPGVDLTIDMSCGADEDLCLWDVCTYLL